MVTNNELGQTRSLREIISTQSTSIENLNDTQRRVFPFSREFDDIRLTALGQALEIIQEINPAYTEERGKVKFLRRNSDVEAAEEVLKRIYDTVDEHVYAEIAHAGPIMVPGWQGKMVEAAAQHHYTPDYLTEIVRALKESAVRETKIAAYWQKKLAVDRELTEALQKYLGSAKIDIRRENFLKSYQGNPAFWEKGRVRAKDPFLEEMVGRFVRSYGHEGNMVVDIGTGAGNEAQEAVKAGAGRVMAIDTSDFAEREIVKRNRELIRSGMSKNADAIRFKRANITTDNFSTDLENTAGGVFALNVAELLMTYERHHMFAEVFKLLKPGGTLLVFSQEIEQTWKLRVPIRQVLDDWGSMRKTDEIQIGTDTFDDLLVNAFMQNFGFAADSPAAGKLKECRTYPQLAYEIELLRRHNPDILESLRFEGVSGEELKALLSLHGFEIVHYRTGIKNESDRWSADWLGDRAGRTDEVCVVAKKP